MLAAIPSSGNLSVAWARSPARAPGAAYSWQMSVAALVLAAGRGERLGGPVPKAFVLLRGRTLLARSVETLVSSPAVDWVIPVVGGGDLDRFRKLNLSHGKLLEPVVGGDERQDSTRAGLAALPDAARWVAVHDAARCLVGADDVRRVVDAARTHGAALLAHPARDTIKRVSRGVVVESPPRRECWVAQTPQVFRVDLLREGLAKASTEGFVGTDDAQLVERLGVDVRVVEGDPRNIKITVPGDLAVAEAWLDGHEAQGGEAT